jgi:hypothetical protein
MDDTLDKMYVEYADFTARILADESEPLKAAAVMATLAASLYRTVLNEEDYNAMMDTISATRGRVQKITLDAEHTLQ